MVTTLCLFVIEYRRDLTFAVLGLATPLCSGAFKAKTNRSVFGYCRWQLYIVVSQLVKRFLATDLQLIYSECIQTPIFGAYIRIIERNAGFVLSLTSFAKTLVQSVVVPFCGGKWTQKKQLLSVTAWFFELLTRLELVTSSLPTF